MQRRLECDVMYTGCIGYAVSPDCGWKTDLWHSNFDNRSFKPLDGKLPEDTRMRKGGGTSWLAEASYLTMWLGKRRSMAQDGLNSEWNRLVLRFDLWHGIPFSTKKTLQEMVSIGLLNHYILFGHTSVAFHAWNMNRKRHDHRITDQGGAQEGRGGRTSKTSTEDYWDPWFM